MKKLYAFLRWPWTPWADVCTFNYGGGSYLVQGRTSLVTKRRQFRSVRCDARWSWSAVGSPSVDQKVLERAGMFQQPSDDVKADVSIRFTP